MTRSVPVFRRIFIRRPLRGHTGRTFAAPFGPFPYGGLLSIKSNSYYRRLSFVSSECSWPPLVRATLARRSCSLSYSLRARSCSLSYSSTAMTTWTTGRPYFDLR